MAKTKKKPAKKAAKKVRKNPTPAESAVAQLEPPDETVPGNAPVDDFIIEDDAVATVIGEDPLVVEQSELSQIMRDYTLGEVEETMGDLGYQLVRTDADADKQREDLDHFWAMIHGLPADARGVARVTVDRLKPLYHEGVETEGYCGMLSLPMSIETIREKYGGGTYRLTLRVNPKESNTTRAPFDRTAIFKIVDPPFPNVGMLSKDERNQGLSWSPEVKAIIEGLSDKVEQLTESDSNRKSSPMEKAMETMMVGMMKKLVDPPAPPPVEPPKTMLEQLRELDEVGNYMRKNHERVFGKADNDAGVDPDDDSMAAQIARSGEAVKSIISTVGDAMEDNRKRKVDRHLEEARARRTATATAPAATPASAEPAERAPKTEEELNDMIEKIDEALEVLWDRLLNSQDHAKSIAERLSEVLAKIPPMFHSFVLKQLSDKNVFEWMEKSAKSEHLDAEQQKQRVDRMTSRRGKAKILKVLKILRGEDTQPENGEE